MLGSIIVYALLGIAEIVSVGKPYSLNVAPGTVFPDNGYTAPGVFYVGKLTDGTAST